uniref:hypothetical protein n=1 Tax=Nocardiopsis lucentensis TaxID=53441 RepID=UPI000375850A
GFQLSMSPSLMDRARSGAEACRILDRAQGEVAAEEYDQAVDSYGGYFAHPASRWEDADGEVADMHLSYAGTLANAAAEGYNGRATGDFYVGLRRAHEIYSLIPVDYEGSEAVGRVPDAMMELYELGTSDYAKERWCPAFDQIGVFADLDWSLAPAVAERIDFEVPDAARRCGWAEVDGGDADRAEEMTDFLAAEYPDHEAEDVEDLVRHVGAAHIQEEMDLLRAGGETEFDTRATGSAGGDVAVLNFTNDTRYDMRFLYVGPDGVHGDITTPGCDDCEDYSSPPFLSSCLTRGGEAMRLELEPGEYRMLLTMVGETRPIHGTVNLSGGNEYQECYFVGG